MSDAWQGALYSLGTAVVFGFFGLSARRGQQYANAPTGVMIGLFVMVPLFWIPAIYLWEPGWWHPEALFYFALAGLFGVQRFEPTLPARYDAVRSAMRASG